MTSLNELIIVHTNCQSAMNKKSEVRDFIDAHNPHVLALTEFGAALLRVGIPIERRLVSSIFDKVRDSTIPLFESMVVLTCGCVVGWSVRQGR